LEEYAREQRQEYLEYLVSEPSGVEVEVEVEEVGEVEAGEEQAQPLVSGASVDRVYRTALCIP
jgi:hypothetical protein